MKEVLAQRRVADALRIELELARAEAGNAGTEREAALREIEAGNFVLTPHEHPHSIENWKLELEKRDRERKQEIAELEAELGEATRAVAATLDGQKPLFRDHNAEPIVLLPVRLETRFEGASRLKIRVFPDDVHVDAFDERLTPAELRAAEAYWRKPGDESWRRLLRHLGPARAAWAKRATRPRAPRKPKLRKHGERRSPRVTTLPTRWRFLGLVGDEVVLDETGAEIPNPLPLGVLAADEESPDREHAAWLTDFDAAVRVGMAIAVKVPSGGLDQLFVVGVQHSPAAEASRHLRDTLLGHAFGRGLGFLAPGTPTNNTPESRSAWSSLRGTRRPRLRLPKRESDAARLARALGLPEHGFLGDCQGAGDMTEQAVAGLTLLSWEALGRGMVDAVQGSALFDDAAIPLDVKAWSGVRDHLVGNVRSRGPLPTIRVGNQPYGVLPTTSLDEWAPGEADGPTGEIAPVLLRIRHHWRAALVPGWIPRVSNAEPADQVAAQILSRLPVAKDLAVRRMLSPRKAMLDKRNSHKHGPPVPIGGVAPGANLRWTLPTEQVSDLAYSEPQKPPDLDLVFPHLDPEPGKVKAILEASADQLADAVAYARGKLTASEYEKRWPLKGSKKKGKGGKKGAGGKRPKRRQTLFSLEGKDPDLFSALIDPRNGEFWEADLGAKDLLRTALRLPAIVDELVTYELGPAARVDKETQAEDRAEAKIAIRLAPKLVRGLRALAATPPEQLAPLALEVLDVYSHRLDAWITSLATRRLHALRHTKDATQSRIGGYGWVENLRPSTADQAVDPGGYIHAPSLQHAATAAVLRSGFNAHDGDQTLAVDLRSRRARVARWLLGGVRRGQDLGSLLGYRFERALHDEGQDELIDGFRRDFPLQLAPEPLDGHEDKDGWANSSVAIAARNVVDGLALARAAMPLPEAEVKARFGGAAKAVAALVDALDAVSDLLLAESVHHLIGGNPLRAGIAADTLGRGEDVPDRFDVLRSPHRGRAVTHRVAALLPAAPRIGRGWSDDALAKLEPRAEAWARDVLGPAAERRLTGAFERDVKDKDGATHTESKDFDIAASRLELGALATAFAISAADTAELAELVRALGKEPGARVSFAGDGWRRSRGAASRVRTLLAGARPLLPEHLAAGAAAEGIEADLEDLRGRLRGFVATLPDRGKGTPGGRLAELAREKKPLDGDWLKRIETPLAEVLGASLPLAPLLSGAKLGPEPDRAAAPRLANWARRNGSVRPAVRTWHELLLLSGAAAGKSPPLAAAQSPMAKGEPWIGGRFPAAHRPHARQSIVFHAPAPLAAGGKLAGIVFDEWVEVLPGSDALAATKHLNKKAKKGKHKPPPPESELTGLSFHYDRPDAKAPQALLVAVPPDPRRGWTGDTLALAVRDTLELAKLRAVDLGDLPLLASVLPGIRIASQSPLGLLASDYWEKYSD
ncbi:MAG TPA: hypothetical protein VFI17_09785 [Solirubrobacterales bacterium]|nr:hypothetical protein [Solirubrobacterales bacterium]